MEARALEACLEYTRSLFAPEDDLLREIRGEIARRGWPEISVSPEEGRLLQLLLRAVGAQLVVEIGTLAGYSAVWLARALPEGGRLITIEREREYAELARDFLRRAGLEGVVEVRVGAAREVLRQLAGAGSFDAVFIDADKLNYPRYLDWSLEHVRRGGLIIADNAYWDGKAADAEARDAETRAIRTYNARIAEHPRLTSLILPIRDGVAVSVVSS